MRSDWWAAIRDRDQRHRGSFVFAVTTTGIYCRPGCASRTPRQANIRLFATAPAAAQAGFRPCRRCHPDQIAAPDPATHAIARACALIRAAETAPKLAELAQSCGYTPAHFHRLFKRVTGVSPRQFAQAERAARAAALLPGAASVTDVIYAAGYASPGPFYATAARQLGMRPAEARRKGEGMAILYDIVGSALGPLLVAASPRGLCAISLGDDATALREGLLARFPNAKPAGHDAGFNALVGAVAALVAAPATPHDLPLDIRGTVFQCQVWQALRKIPPGHTASYSEIARAIGQPNAARAVGAACGANPLAVAIPCHRVVRADNGPSGYRWGKARKQALLASEREPE